MSIRKILHFLFPGALLFACTYALPYSRYWYDIESVHIDIVGAVILTIGLVLAWRFDRCRLLYILLLLVTVDGVDRWFLQPEYSNAAHLLTAILVPVNFLLVGLLPEKGINNRFSLLQLSLLPLQVVAGGFWIVNSAPQIQVLLQRSHLPAPLETVPDIQFISILVAFVLHIYRYLRSTNAMDAAFFWALLGATAASIIPSGPEATLLRLGALTSLNLALFEMSYALAYRDELTGIPGRRALSEASRKLTGAYCVAMADIDYFKKLNDSYGHDIGDQVLRMVAARLVTCRTDAEVYRYGGEEFCLIFKRKSVQDATAELERLRKAIADEPFLIRRLTRPLKKPKTKKNPDKTRQSIGVTISIGVAARDERRRQFEEVIKAADQALYKAKKAGRNQVRS